MLQVSINFISYYNLFQISLESTNSEADDDLLEFKLAAYLLKVWNKFEVS